jgi:Kef-type K+ transport system membrane component KefB
MGLIDILCSSIFLFTVVESTSRSGNMWLHNVGVESTGTVSWTVFSASIFVLVALVLSMYLIFEHLAAYNQPEVGTRVPLLLTFESYLFFLLHQ